MEKLKQGWTDTQTGEQGDIKHGEVVKLPFWKRWFSIKKRYNKYDVKLIGTTHVVEYRLYRKYNIITDKTVAIWVEHKGRIVHFNADVYDKFDGRIVEA